MSSDGLPENWRIQVFNDTGVASGGDVEVTAQETKRDSDGTLEYNAEIVLRAAATLADQTHDESGTQDNSAAADLWTGLVGVLDANITTATPDGNVELWFQASTDGGTTWPNHRGTLEGNCRLLTAINFTATGQKISNWSL